VFFWFAGLLILIKEIFLKNKLKVYLHEKTVILTFGILTFDFDLLGNLPCK